MRYTYALIFFAVCQVRLQAAHAESSDNPDDILKKIADFLSEAAKKLEESIGVHAEFDKEKFLTTGKEFTKKLAEIQAKWKESYETNFKNSPNVEEIKAKIEEVQKQWSEVLKNINSPEAQKSLEKLRETLYASSKKINDSFYDLSQKLGIAPSPSIQKKLNEIYEESAKSFKTFQEKFQKLIEQFEKELKKKN